LIFKEIIFSLKARNTAHAQKKEEKEREYNMGYNASL
jgi:hypothetical protein